ncbi:MAG: sodium:calcium antiporter [Pirellulaceae bacterium]|nr:sodium:calcium antiporter [Pirellulaceae bacterium]
MGIAIPLIVIVFTCLIIWRACDAFEIASEYLGRNMSEGVRGGTINAISSSVPELLTTLIALFVLADEEGFSIGLGTTAGSALFNGMIIPAACILFVVGTVIAGKRVTTVQVSTKVILRDGLTLIACNFILILLINGNALHWWQGLVLILMYAAYLAYMILSMRKNASNIQPVTDSNERSDDSAQDRESYDVDVSVSRSRSVVYWATGGPVLDLETHLVREHHREQIKNEEWNAWPLLLTSTALIGIACWMLVIACEWLGTGPSNRLHPSYTLMGKEFTGLGMPAMFVAVIFAAMATSVPDTIISIRDALDGEYDDAVANALGSNIFDICFALGFPLLLYTLIHGSIHMPADVVQQSSEIRILLLVMTIIGFIIYYAGPRSTDAHGHACVQLGRGKAVMLIVLYLLFVAFIIGKSANYAWAVSLSSLFHYVLDWIPQFGWIQPSIS